MSGNLYIVSSLVYFPACLYKSNFLLRLSAYGVLKKMTFGRTPLLLKIKGDLWGDTVHLSHLETVL